MLFDTPCELIESKGKREEERRGEKSEESSYPSCTRTGEDAWYGVKSLHRNVLSPSICRFVG